MKITKKYLNSVTWDGIERINRFFTECFGARDTETSKVASRHFWIGYAASVLHPGCRLGTPIILVGTHGCGTTEALALMGVREVGKECPALKLPRNKSKFFVGTAMDWFVTKSDISRLDGRLIYVNVRLAKLDMIKDNLPQLLAEATTYCNRGEKWWTP